MKIDAVLEMIHKNGNLVDQSNALPLKRPKSAIRELILNNNSVLALSNYNGIDEERHSGDSNDDNNNDHFIRQSDSRRYRCPVCKSEQFTAGELLDQHLRTHHPAYRPSCRDCGELFPTLKSLARHSVMHVTEGGAIRHNPLNSKIIDFLENKKFLIKQLSDSIETSQSFRCNICGDHLAGAHFVSHWGKCKQLHSEASANTKLPGDSEDSKSHFFAGLNLRSHLDSRNSSDSESYGSAKSDRVPDDDAKIPGHLINAIRSASPPSYPVPQFESEDNRKLTKDESDFLNRVRDMKRRGEFPCRLCTKVFRNLRALKGHARVHIAGIRNSRPYQCNICLFSTGDKSVIIRHIRNHNGDHPYKCQLCLSTFTTKANCERHLRNAHRKTSREDIKRLLVDLNNKPQNTPATVATPATTINKLETLLTGGQVKDTKDRYSSFSSSHHDSSENDERSRNSLQFGDRSEHRSDAEDSINSNDSNNNTSAGVLGEKKLDSYRLIPTLNTKYSDFRIAGLLDMGGAKTETEIYKYPLAVSAVGKNNLLMRANFTLQDGGFIKVAPFARLCEAETAETEEPLDLSVDIHDEGHEDADVEDTDTTDDAVAPTGDDTEALVLDLRKKKDTDVEDLSVRNRNGDRTPPNTSRDSLPPSPRLFLRNSTPYTFPSAPVMPPLSQFFAPTSNLGAAFPGVPKADTIDGVADDDTHPSKLRPLMYEHLVANVGDRFGGLRQNVAAFVDFTEVTAGTVGAPGDRDDHIAATVAKDIIAAKARSNSKSSTVKMVMKDGVLVEKQKQRRYRTEKPFSCAYCPGRFTLRSNMDRHVKQQHPSHWRQRQRGGSSRTQRTKLKDDTSDSVSVKSEPHMNQQLEAGSLEGDCEMSFEKQSLECSDADVEDDMENEMVRNFKKEESMDCGAGEEDDEDGEDLVIDEEVKDAEITDERNEVATLPAASAEKEVTTKEENPDLASVRSLLDNVSTQTFSQYFGNEEDRSSKHDDGSEEDEEGLVAGSSSEGNGSGGEENRAPADANAKIDETNANGAKKKKKSAYSSAPNRVHCDFCSRSFPWASSLRRHTLTHTGQKPYKCSNCPLLFTTKSNCDRHFLRKHRSQLAAVQQQQQPTAAAVVGPTCAIAAAATVSPSAVASVCGNVAAVPTDNAAGPTGNRLIPNFSTRNVPERPFKCSHCPSSTFSTYQNLKKHVIEKHNRVDGGEPDESCDRDPCKVPREEAVPGFALSDVSDQSDKAACDEKEGKASATASVPALSTATSADQNFCGHVSSDLPFKCHLCDRSFGERQEALDHMSESHPTEFRQLICKGALDMNVKLEDAAASHEETAYSNGNSDENNVEPNRGRFPDYSCRKVICAFCLRRFWSAEDLRRHMRTHTGERPFSCDICQRRFTLKHSMLRHRKKHSNKAFASASGDASPNTDDEEPASPFSDHRGAADSSAPPAGDRLTDLSGSSLASAPCSSSCSSSANHSSLEFDSSADAQSDPAGSVAAHCAKAEPAVAGAASAAGVPLAARVGLKEDGVDLIAKLLDIDDKQLVDEMLTSKSADDVAKMLGVQK